MFAVATETDPRLDREETPDIIFGARWEEEYAKVRSQQRLDSWILDQDLDWLLKDRAYWKEVFLRATAETFVPGTRIFSHYRVEPTLHSASYGDPEKDRVLTFWILLTYKFRDKIGSQDPYSPDLLGYKDFKAAEAGPRTPGQWIRALRFMIRHEETRRRAGVRETLEDYPPDIRALLQSEFDRLSDGCEYVDNQRFAEMSKRGEIRRYKTKKRSGCCGFVDEKVTIKGKPYLIGFNYGH